MKRPDICRGAGISAPCEPLGVEEIVHGGSPPVSDTTRPLGRRIARSVIEDHRDGAEDAEDCEISQGDRDDDRQPKRHGILLQRNDLGALWPSPGTASRRLRLFGAIVGVLFFCTFLFVRPSREGEEIRREAIQIRENFGIE